MKVNNFLSKGSTKKKEIEKERETRKKTARKILKKACKRLRKESKTSKRTKQKIMEIYGNTPRKYLSPVNLDTMLCAIIIVGCQIVGEPITIRESQKALEITPRAGQHLTKRINEKKRRLYQKLEIRIVPSSPVDYIDRWCKKLNLDKEIAEKSKEIVNTKKNIEIEEVAPTSKAIAAIGIAAKRSGQEISFEKLKEVTGINKVTIRDTAIKIQ